MRHARLVALCFTAGTWLGVPAVAHACSCGGPLPSSATNARASDIVFLGTVATLEKPAGAVRVDPAPISTDARVLIGPEYFSYEGPTRVIFDVHRLYRGREARQVTLALDRICDPPFSVGQEWLVYASEGDGRLETSVCSRTRLAQEAASDIEFLDGVARGRQQGVVHGAAHQRIVDANGQPQLRVLFESLRVVAVGSGRRFDTLTDGKSSYQLVLPPGDFEIWVERAGRRVSAVDRVRVTADMDRELMVAASF